MCSVTALSLDYLLLTFRENGDKRSTSPGARCRGEGVWWRTVGDTAKSIN